MEKEKIIESPSRTAFYEILGQEKGDYYWSELDRFGRQVTGSWQVELDMDREGKLEQVLVKIGSPDYSNLLLIRLKKEKISLFGPGLRLESGSPLALPPLEVLGLNEDRIFLLTENGGKIVLHKELMKEKEMEVSYARVETVIP